MKRPPIQRRRAAYLAMFSILLIGVLELATGTAYHILETGSGAWVDVEGQTTLTESMLSWTSWWFTLFELALVAALVVFAWNAEKLGHRVFAIAGAVASGLNLFSGSLIGWFIELYPSTFFMLHGIGAFRLVSYASALYLARKTGLFEERSAAWQALGLGLFGIPVYFFVQSAVSSMNLFKMVGLAPALIAVSAPAVHRIIQDLRERDIPAGVESELGIELVRVSILLRVVLAAIASISAAFIWTPNIFSVAGLSTVLGALAIPAALGMSRLDEQIVRGAHSRLTRAGTLWWLAAALWMGQLVWLYLMGPGLSTFGPAVLATIVEVFAWNQYRSGLGEWAREERDPREALSKPPAVPIVLTGVLVIGAFGVAFHDIDWAVWVISVAGLVAFVAAYLILNASHAALASIRESTYIDA